MIRNRIGLMERFYEYFTFPVCKVIFIFTNISVLRTSFHTTSSQPFLVLGSLNTRTSLVSYLSNSQTYINGFSWCSKELCGGQSDTFLRRLQKEWFSQLDNDILLTTAKAAGTIWQHFQFGHVLECLLVDRCSSNLEIISYFSLGHGNEQVRGLVPYMALWELPAPKWVKPIGQPKRVFPARGGF